MRLVFASRNRDKIAELRDTLLGLPLDIRSAEEFPDAPDVEETGSTLEENALLKARAVHQVVGGLCLADDTGLEVEALQGAPGVHSARYGGPEQSYEKNLHRLIAEMAGVPEPHRGARFRTVVALIFPDHRETTIEGVCEGMILAEPRGTKGFGYDPVFWVPEVGKTFAEMGLPEKQNLSHRGRAMRRVREILDRFLGASDQEA